MRIILNENDYQSHRMTHPVGVLEFPLRYLAIKKISKGLDSCYIF